MAYIIRIRFDLIRIPLLCLFWPFSFVTYVLVACLPTCIGGHPNKERLLQASFYSLPVYLFWAAWDGAFVSMKRK